MLPAWVTPDTDSLLTWQCLAEALEGSFPGELPCVRDIADASVTLVGAGRLVYLSGPGRAGLWREHAAQVCELLARQCRPVPALGATVERALQLIPPPPLGVRGDELAAKLGVTPGSFRKHIVPKLKKLGVRNMQNGLGYQRT
jgi:hypothetical protein